MAFADDINPVLARSRALPPPNTYTHEEFAQMFYEFFDSQDEKLACELPENEEELPEDIEGKGGIVLD